MSEDWDRRKPVRIEEGGTPAERRATIVQILTREGPMTCKALTPLMPGYTSTILWPCPDPTYHDRVEECVHAKQTHVWKPGYSNVYADLRHLEDERKVIRETELGRPKVGDGPAKSVRWMAWSPEDEEAEAIASIMQAIR